MPGGILGKLLGSKVSLFKHLQVAIFSWGLLLSAATQAAIPPTVPAQPGLTSDAQHATLKPAVACTQAYGVAKWAHMRFGGPKPPLFHTPAFAERVASALMEKWDPFHVLHTQKEVTQFKRSVKQHWEQFSQARSCLGMSQVIEAHVKTLEARVQKFSQQANLKAVIPSELRKTERFGDTQMYHYRDYAATLATLNTRIESELKLILKDLTPGWWQAFDKDGRKLVHSILQNRFSVDTSKTSPHWILLGALAALDPYSTYLTENEFDELTKDLSGVASGIGIRVRTIPVGLMIRQVLEDSPAGRSGELLAGDWITTVNGKPLASLSEHAKQDALQGSAGQMMHLRIQRGQKQMDVKLKREEIKLEDARVSFHIVPRNRSEGDVAIIRIPSFYGESGWNAQGESLSAALDVEKALKEIGARKTPVAAIVLDLRGNPGGFLEEAVSMAGLFLGNQPVVGVSSGDTVKILRNYHRKPIYSGPLVVALDPDSASASEVLAGALSDNGRGVIVAESHTYGKGSVQRLFPLKEINDSELPLSKTVKVGAVKLTTSLFFSPKGVSPEGTGVTAHIWVGTKPADTTAKPHTLKKVYEAALAAVDKAESMRPSVSETIIRDLEARSRHRPKAAQESLGKTLSKILQDDVSAEISPGLVEAVAIARDFNTPAVAVKN